MTQAQIEAYNKIPVRNQTFSGLNYVGLFLLFLIHPVSALVVALYNYNRKGYLFLIALFTCYYGYYVNPNTKGDDLVKYLNILPMYHALPFDSFFKVMSGYFAQKGESVVDLYRNFIIYVVSRFTTDGHALMAVFGFFFGALYALSISLFVKQTSIKNFYLVIILIAFSFELPLNMLGGVRYGTAGYLFFYGAIRFINEPKRNNLLIAASALLVHFAYIPLVALLIIHHFIKKWPFIYYLFFFVSFIDVNMPAFIEEFTRESKGAIGQSAYGYSKEEYVRKRFELLQLTKWKVRGQWLVQEFFFYLLLIIYNLKRRIPIRITDYSKNIFFFTLLLYSFAHLFRNVPSLGERSLVVSLMFVMYFMYVLYKDNLNRRIVKILAILAFLAAGMRIFISFRAILTSLEPSFYFGNFFLNGIL